MAVTITLGQLAVAVRVQSDPAAAVAEPYAGILQRLLDVATGRIQNYSPDAADADANEAATRFVGYCLDRPTAYSGQAYADAFRNSGAQVALSESHDVTVVML